jgi:hypothetical protein
MKIIFSLISTDLPALSMSKGSEWRNPTALQITMPPRTTHPHFDRSEAQRRNLAALLITIPPISSPPDFSVPSALLRAADSSRNEGYYVDLQLYRPSSRSEAVERGKNQRKLMTGLE